MKNLTKEKVEIIIGLLESTLGDMPAKEADDIVRICVDLLKGKNPQVNNKASNNSWNAWTAYSSGAYLKSL